MKQSIRLAVLATTAAFATAKASAWNDAGHKTVALFAYRELDDGSKVKLLEILEKHPHFKTFLTKGLPEGVDRGEWIFMQEPPALRAFLRQAKGI